MKNLKFTYPALIQYDESESVPYFVQFPDLVPGVTDGTSFDNAIFMAEDLLKLMISTAPKQCFAPTPIEKLQEEFPDGEIHLIEVEVPDDEVARDVYLTNKLDEILLDENVYAKFIEAYDKDEDFKDILRNLIPEAEDCLYCKQNNPWHIYPVLEHILRSVEYMNRLAKEKKLKREARMLSYIMFFHDLGKPRAKKVVERDGVKRDSFPVHAYYSRKIAEKALPHLRFEEDEVSVMAELIDRHDVFIPVTMNPTLPHHIKLDEAFVENQIRKLDKFGDGKKLLYLLIQIARADNLAQNPELTKEPLNNLRLLEEILSTL
ncbi:MAG: HD domain-containing protein [Bacilli bacterium]|nr:HD domain-containing protein [Bacilli bacterium]